MNREKTIYNRIIKRILDVICSFMAIVFLSIIYLPICVVIKCTSKGPIFFKQKRIGKDKKYFSILKIRTMRIDTPKDCPTHLLKNPEQYITKVGKFLRKTSLDELPQIFNIFKGDMSVIGKRDIIRATKRIPFFQWLCFHDVLRIDMCCKCRERKCTIENLGLLGCSFLTQSN